MSAETAPAVFPALVQGLDGLSLAERLTVLRGLPAVVEAATVATMAEAQASGMTWREIGEAWGGTTAQNAEQWFSRRR